MEVTGFSTIGIATCPQSACLLRGDFTKYFLELETSDFWYNVPPRLPDIECALTETLRHFLYGIQSRPSLLLANQGAQSWFAAQTILGNQSLFRKKSRRLFSDHIIDIGSGQSPLSQRICIRPPRRQRRPRRLRQLSRAQLPRRPWRPWQSQVTASYKILDGPLRSRTCHRLSHLHPTATSAIEATTSRQITKVLISFKTTVGSK